jgi:putative endonuclease
MNSGRQTHDGLDPRSRRSNNEGLQYFVYLLASGRNGTLYVGVTNDLIRRIHEHKNDLVDGFTEKYGVHLLVWFESTPSVEAAIHKEKQIKNWKRAWKVALIEKTNPEWRDLYESIL